MSYPARVEGLGKYGSDHLKRHDVDCVFGFSSLSIRLVIVLWVHHLIQTEIFSSEKMFGWRGCLIWKAFQRSFSSSRPVIKNWPFLKMYEKYQISSCTTCLIKNSDTLMSLAMDLIDLLGSLLIIAWISSRNLGVLFLREKS